VAAGSGSRRENELGVPVHQCIAFELGEHVLDVEPAQLSAHSSSEINQL
jgi:hypothetical protein